MRRLGQAPLRRLQIVIVVLTGVVAVFWGWSSWTARYEAAVETAQRNSDLVREYVLRLVQTRRALMGPLNAFFRDRSPEEFGDAVSHAFLKASELPDSKSYGLALIGPNGDFLASSLMYPARGNVGDREYLRRTAAGDAIFVDRIRLRPGGQDALVIAQRLEGEPYRGLIASTLDIGSVTDFLKRIASEKGSAASVLRADGMLLVRNANSEPVRVADSAPVMTAIRGNNRGVFEALAASDGVRRIYAFSKIGDLPLYANYGLSRRNLIEEWAAEFGRTAAFLLAIAALSWAALWQARRRIEAEVDRVQLEEARKASDLKEAMLREMNHRVKNSLQSIQALIAVKQRRERLPFADEVAQRVNAIADIHDLLYSSDDQIHINLKDFLGRICANESLFPPERGIRSDCRLQDVMIGFGQATPIALIVVELVTNALKHAFVGRTEGTVTVRLTALGDDRAEIIVADDGIGMSPSGRRSGIRIVERLIEQLDGHLAIETDQGTRFRLTFAIRDGV